MVRTVAMCRGLNQGSYWESFTVRRGISMRSLLIKLLNYGYSTTFVKLNFDTTVNLASIYISRGHVWFFSNSWEAPSHINPLALLVKTLRHLVSVLS